VAGGQSTLDRIKAFNEYLFDDQRFVGNRDRYEDPRNSCINEVLDRRTGIPITLSLIYMEIGGEPGCTWTA
jgi:regulator of sirC expression with transglutaminase-like and TPR domain